MEILKYILVFVLCLAAGNSGAFRWVTASLSEHNIHPRALQVGTDADGDIIYAGRTHYAGDILPAKVIPAKHSCYVAFGGKEYKTDEFEVLVPAQFQWQTASNGAVPPSAVEAGITSTKEKLYLGRVMHKGSITPGKIHPSQRCMYYPFDGEEYIAKEYECLVLE